MPPCGIVLSITWEGRTNSENNNITPNKTYLSLSLSISLSLFPILYFCVPFSQSHRNLPNFPTLFPLSLYTGFVTLIDSEPNMVLGALLPLLLLLLK